jgi:hypothetical protein
MWPTVLVAASMILTGVGAAEAVQPESRLIERTIHIGQPIVVEFNSKKVPFSVVFEDDGETGYFYAVDNSKTAAGRVADALWIYDVKSSLDASTPRAVQIRWSVDGLKAGLFVDGSPQAVFDFSARRGYNRANFPATSTWSRSNHAWDSSIVAGLD